MAKWTLHTGQVSPVRPATRSATSLEAPTVILRGSDFEIVCFALGQKTSDTFQSMSALPPKVNIEFASPAYGIVRG